MQVFKLFLKILKKNIFISLIYIVVFLGISIPLTQMDNREKNFRESVLKVVLFDHDETAESQALVGFVGSKHQLVSMEEDRKALIDALYYEQVDYVLVIEKGFAEKLAENPAEEELFQSYYMQENYSTSIMSRLLDGYVNAARAYLASGLDSKKACQKAAEATLSEVSVTVFTPKGSENFSAGITGHFRYLSYVILSVIITALCPVLLTLNKQDFRYRTNCSSLNQSAYVMQEFLGSALFVSLFWVLVVILSLVVNKGLFVGNAWFAILNTLIFCLVSTGFALLVCAFEPSDTVLNMMTQIIGLASSFLCGVFIPLSMLGKGVLTVAKFLPSYWYVKVLEMLSGNEPYDLKRILLYFGIQLGFAAALLLMALVVHRLKYTASSLGTKRAATLA